MRVAQPATGMARQGATTGSKTIALVAAVVTLIVVGTIGFALVSSRSGGTTNSSTSSTSSGGSTTNYSTTSASGLRLQIQLNATTMQSGSALAAQVTLFNTLTENLSLKPNFSANPNIANWDNYDSLCGLNQAANTFGFALYQEHFAAGNLSQAGTPMMLTPPVATGCPNRFASQAYIQNVEFAPESYLATMSANSSFSSVFKAQATRMQLNATTGSCSTSPYKESGTSVENGVTTTYSGTELAWGCGSNSASSLTGYWTMPDDGNYVEIDAASNSTITAGLNSVYQSYFHRFSPGSYTMVAEDLWNQTVYAYFQVVSAASSPVQVVSVMGPIPPYYAGGPVVSVTLQNVGSVPITSLAASLQIPRAGPIAPFSFVFNVNSSNPLLPGRSVQETRTLIGAGFDSSLDYPLTISGTLSNGTQFSYTEQVLILPPNNGIPPSALGLTFALTQNATQIVTGQAINITADIRNVLPRTNNVTGASDWALPVFQDWMKSTPCPSYAYILILQGYFIQSNISFASPLQISPPGLVVGCPAFLGSYYLFQPSSDKAPFFGGEAVLSMRAEAVVSGYYLAGQSYNYTLPSGGISPTPFPVGVYTVVAGDEWAQVAISHFSVVSG